MPCPPLEYDIGPSKPQKLNNNNPPPTLFCPAPPAETIKPKPADRESSTLVGSKL